MTFSKYKKEVIFIETQKKPWADGSGYDKYIQAELKSFRKNAWKTQFKKHFGNDTPKKILDVGTGPGFFACILSEEGHNVVGIDSSEGMLKCAIENADKLGVTPEFINMDVNSMNFEDSSFDVIVTRNVTWTMEHPDKVYTEFHRILKPAGILLIYDANWHLHFFDDEKLKRVRELERKHFEKYGKEEIVSSGNMEYLAKAPLTRTIRPQWDEKILTNLDFKVSIHENIGEEVYGEWEKELYAESPLFEVCAIKNVKCAEIDNMHKYWQKRSESFGFNQDNNDFVNIGEEYVRYLPKENKEQIKVLDIGTGTGIIAASIALWGYNVTGIDMCSNMIKRAKSNVKELELDIDFLCTTAGDLPFEDDSFDVIVSRNLTWALPYPEKTFLSWQRVLKPRGLLIYKDANQYYYRNNIKEMENRQRYLEINKETRIGYHDNYDTSLCDDTAADMPMAKVNRPYDWDDIVLPKLGFDIVVEEIKKPQNKLKYNIGDGFNTHFLIVAINGKEFKSKE